MKLYAILVRFGKKISGVGNMKLLLFDIAHAIAIPTKRCTPKSGHEIVWIEYSTGTIVLNYSAYIKSLLDYSRQ